MGKLVRRNRKGFTLVELVVVIAILGILAAIAVPQFLGKLDTAKETADQTTLSNVQSAVNMYYFDKGSYPADTDTLVTAGYIGTVTLQKYASISINTSNGKCTLVAAS